MKLSYDGRVMTYLDYNAGAPVHQKVREKMMEALELQGNPSSVHRYGREARQALEQARRTIANTVGATPGQVIFVSGGTEANALAYHQHAPEKRLVSAVEHPSATDGALQIAVTKQGCVDLADLQQKLKDHDVSLVSVMAANNETGVIQPIIECADIAREASAKFHVDAVQMLGKAPCSIAEWDADSISLSSHKIGGPKGIGALVIRDGLPITPLIAGGGQELRRRGGTENLPAIVGFATAVEVMSEMDGWQKEAANLRDYAEREIANVAPDARFFGQDTERLCNTSTICMPGVKAETQLMAYDLAGVAVSAGSACSSGKVAASPVLTAMGASDEEAASSIRMSLGWRNRKQDVDLFISAWVKLYQRTRANAA
jgi:cysteine desulfurase